MTASDDLFAVLDARQSARCTLWSDVDSGLRAILVIDDITLGPAAGGTRLRAYPSLAAAVDDAARLARAMTLKCALGGLSAGGAKIVVMDHPGLRRRAAFERLGRFVEELRGQLLTAGDLGTTADDIAAMAEHTRYAHTGEADLAASVAKGLAACMGAAARIHGRRDSVAGLRVAVQGCGSMGAAVARHLAALGGRVVLADIDHGRAQALARDIGAEVVPAAEILDAEVDVLCPCALGGAIDVEVARRVRAFAVCGAANNILAHADAGRVLSERGISFVPDVISSAGAVIDGVGERIMGLDSSEREALIGGLGQTAYDILSDSRRTGRLPEDVAVERARERIRAAGGDVRRSDGLIEG